MTSFSADFPEFSNVVTKRQVLSIVAKLYAPLGLLSLLTIRSRMFFQSLWSFKFSECGYDLIGSQLKLNGVDPLPVELLK